jgi:NAD(P)-dependent dehydrogenase (short-subunit alcohol dehydrogenase family)
MHFWWSSRRTRPLVNARDTEGKGRAYHFSTALGRFGEPDEISEMVVWLCSDRFSYVTGSAYAVDGGWTAI